MCFCLCERVLPFSASHLDAALGRHTLITSAHSISRSFSPGICLIASNCSSDLSLIKECWHFEWWVRVFVARQISNTWAGCVCVYSVISTRRTGSKYASGVWHFAVAQSKVVLGRTHLPHGHARGQRDTRTYTHSCRDKQVVAFVHESLLWAGLESFLVWTFLPCWHFWSSFGGPDVFLVPRRQSWTDRNLVLFLYCHRHTHTSRTYRMFHTVVGRHSWPDSECQRILCSPSSAAMSDRISHVETDVKSLPDVVMFLLSALLLSFCHGPFPSKHVDLSLQDVVSDTTNICWFLQVVTTAAARRRNGESSFCCSYRRFPAGTCQKCPIWIEIWWFSGLIS